MAIPTVSIILLRGWFLYTKSIGAVFWHFKHPKNYEMAMDESWWNRSWWKWISIVLHLVPLCVNVYTCCFFIWNLPSFVDQVVNSVRLVIITFSCVSLIYLQLFHGKEVITLINQYLSLFYRVTALSVHSVIGFGGGRELCLIILSLGCQVQEIVFLLALFRFRINQGNFLSWSSSTYCVICCSLIQRLCFIWYLSLGVVLSNLNEYLRLETQYYRRTQKLKNAMTHFREISYLVPSLEKLSNKYLFLSLIQTLFSMISLSYKMIADRQFYQFWIWFWFVKIMLDMLILSLTIEGAVNQFRYIRELIPDMFLLSDLTEWNRELITKFSMLGPEVLDEEFECLRRIALAICQTLGRPKDREVCRSTLDAMAKFNKSPSIKAKENVHKFMVFYLKVLRWTQKNQPMTIYDKWYGKNSDDSYALNSADSEEMRVWLQEGTSFFAMKTFEDGSTMVYTAVAKDPKAGWAEFGLKSLMDLQNGCKK